MNIDTNTAASVQDASFSRKDGIVVEKLNATETPASDAESVPIKQSEADCSSTVDNTDLEKMGNERDELLEQIEEVCNDNVSSLKNSEDISKTEHEFFKEIDEIENSDKHQDDKGTEKANEEELKAKNILECEAETIDTVVINNTLIVVKDNLNEENVSPTAATSSEDFIDTKKSVEKTDDNSRNELPNKDATVSSSTNKIEKMNTDQNISEKSVNSPAKILLENDEQGKHCELVAEIIQEKLDISDKNMETKSNVEEANISERVSAKEVSADKTIEPKEVDDACVIKTKAPIADATMPLVELKGTSVQSSLFDKSLNIEVGTASDGSLETDSRSGKDKLNEKVETKKCENKTNIDVKLKESLVSSSLTNTPVSSTNVFNSTPIQKQFEISSENVSKISDAAECSHTEKEEATSSKSRFDYSTSESGTCLTSESDQLSSDGTMKKYLNAIKKYNGMPDTTTDEENTSVAPQNKKDNDTSEVKSEQLTRKVLKRDSLYEVTVCCEENDVRYLSIERLNNNGDKCKTTKEEKMSISESSVQSSSNGSVSSLPVYSFPQIVGAVPSESTSSSINCHSLIATQKKHTIVGIEEVCNFMINHFTSIKQAINPGIQNELQKELGVNINTPHVKKNKKNNSSIETPIASASKNKRARKRSLQEEDSEVTPKSKQQKKDQGKEMSKANENEHTEESEGSKIGPCVLAKWVDKKFYAGKITAEKPGNKFVVLFEDGASKTLPKESIVFGEGEILPLQDQQVYASIEDDYECGVVLSIEKSNNKVIYTVKTETTIVKVTASDIYLEVDQAKEIQKIQNTKVGESIEEEEAGGSRPSRNKRPPASPSTPEAGFSGTTGKRGGKRQKRFHPTSIRSKGLSDDSIASDTEESTPPISPKEEGGLELVEGVQPELQNSQTDSELSRMIFTSDYKQSQPNCDVDDLLGPLPNSGTLFRNKVFLLTCTIGLKPHLYNKERMESNENKKFKQFSAVPFIKNYLQKQLETGGATVYSYFEDVPKNKYKMCKLIAPKPCLTAKYVQCLSSNIQAISHDWVIDSCRVNKMMEFKKYELPAGWSILSETFIQWKIGKDVKSRGTVQPFSKTYILIAGEHSDFIEFWGRVCKAAGGKLRLIKSLDDITPTTTGYMVSESDLSNSIKAKAQYYGIPVVSTVWVTQSLIMGSICTPHSHPKLSQSFEDDEI